MKILDVEQIGHFYKVIAGNCVGIIWKLPKRTKYQIESNQIKNSAIDANDLFI